MRGKLVNTKNRHLYETLCGFGSLVAYENGQEIK
jgi:hypothetical protein